MNKEIRDRLELIQQCLHEAPAALAFSGVGHSTNRIWWDCYREVFVAKRSRRTASLLYGSAWHLPHVHSARFFVGALRRRFSCERFVGPFDLDGPGFNDDAVIRVRLQGLDGGNVVLCSKDQGAASKAGIGYWPSDFVRREVDHAEMIEDTAMGGHVPALLNHGGDVGSIYWIQKKLVPNSPPIFIPDRTIWWQHQLAVIMPIMWDFYSSSGKLIDNVAWCERLTSLWKEKPDDERHELRHLLELTQSALPDAVGGRMMLTTIHGDLSPINFHTCGGDWWVFDWAFISSMPPLYDVISHPCQTGQWGDDVWDWVCSDNVADGYPEGLRGYHLIWAELLSSWWGESLTPRIFRFQLLATLLESHLGFRKDARVLAAIRSRCEVGG